MRVCWFCGSCRSLCVIHTADADATKLFCRVGVGGVNTFATSSRRLPTDSVDNVETGQTDQWRIQDLPKGGGGPWRARGARA